MLVQALKVELGKIDILLEFVQHCCFQTQLAEACHDLAVHRSGRRAAGIRQPVRRAIVGEDRTRLARAGRLEEIKRPLMTPDEIMRLRTPKKESTGHQEKIIAPGDMLIFVSGYPPIYGTQMLYFRDPILRSRAEIPPPTKFYSIHDGSLSPQDSLPDLVPPKPAPGPRPRRRPGSSSGSSPETPTLFDQRPPSVDVTLQPPKSFAERLDLDSER